MTIDRNDPRWTAYVLDELDGGERARFEAEIAATPESEEILAEVRESVALLTGSFALEAPVGLTEDQRRTVMESLPAARPARRATSGRWTVAAGIAATLLVGVVTVTVVRQIPNPGGEDPAATIRRETAGIRTPQPAPEPSTSDAASEAVETTPTTPTAPVAAEPPEGTNAATDEGRPSRLVGTILDRNGARIPNVSITATNTATGVREQLRANENGVYAVAVEPGTYQLKAEVDGFRTEGYDNIEINPTDTLSFDFYMQQANAGEEVNVFLDARERVSFDSASVGQTLGQEQLAELPTILERALEEAQFENFAGVQADQINTVRDRAGVDEVRQLANAEGQQGQQGQAAGQGRGARGGAFGDVFSGVAGGVLAPAGGATLGTPAAAPPPPPPAATTAPARLSAEGRLEPPAADRALARPNTEEYDRVVDSPSLPVSEQPLSTFSIDVDTASYANVRRFLNQRALPPADAVRIEEMINYFTYDYAPPRDGRPVRIHAEVAGAPWAPGHRLVRIGIQGQQIERDERAASNLVFLIDVSGSMNDANKLPLLVSGMKLLVEQLGENDRIAIVVYAGSSGLVLDSTPGFRTQRIMAALDSLRASGSTNGAAGIQLAYDVAVRNFIDGGVNRVILATDGDFNVGVSSTAALERLIEQEARTGVFLSVLGFGTGNLNDAGMEALADRGNGNYAYIDSIREARKVLVEEIGSTLVTIARDVKIQVEFNPAEVSAYRLIGYENRALRNQDFNNDAVDAGEIGAGHTVTALYEVVPVGVALNVPGVDPLRYQQPLNLIPTDAASSGEMLNVKVRYKAPDGDESVLIEAPLLDREQSFEAGSADYRFAAAVAGFGMLLRDSPYRGSATWDSIVRIAETSRGEDTGGYREEFLDLVRRARAIDELD